MRTSGLHVFIVTVVFLVSLPGLLKATAASAQALPNTSGLFHSPAELALWRDRAQNGPFKKAGDKQQGSPGDWERISKNASDFLSNPKSGHWNGQFSGCYDSQDDFGRGRFKTGYQIKDAAFYYLITGDSRHLNAVKNELLSLAREGRLDWTNDKLYGCPISGNNTLELNSWMVKHVIAYSFIRNSISAGERGTLDTWFRNYGRRYVEYNMSNIDKRFTDSANTKPKQQSCPTSGGRFNEKQPLYIDSPYYRCYFHQA